jgi:hypothetical protein
MYYPRYKCSADYPDRIPDILKSCGLAVIVGPWVPIPPSPSKEFGYVVSDGSYSIYVTGGTLQEGITAFVVALPIELDLRFWLRRKKKALRQQVESILADGGAELWHDYPGVRSGTIIQTDPIQKKPPNQRPEGTPGKSSPSKPSQVPGAPHP